MRRRAVASQAYLDEYWCMIFIFDPARRLVSKQLAPTGAFGPVRPVGSPVPQRALSPAALAMGFVQTDL
jgi:hypothetical protein